MRKTAGNTWADYETNTESAKELIQPQVWEKYRNTEESGYVASAESLVTGYPG